MIFIESIDLKEMTKEQLEAYSAIGLYSKVLVDKYKNLEVSEGKIPSIQEWINKTYMYYMQRFAPQDIIILFNYLNNSHGLLKNESLEMDKNKGIER